MSRDVGLELVGVTGPEPFHEAAQYTVDHVRRGHMRGMDWFTEERAHQAADPHTLQENVQSVISVGVPFWTSRIEPPDDGVLRGRIARYAWGRNYHRVLRSRMKALAARIEDVLGRELETRTLVDTARVFDRQVAARAGVGWFGKNSMIIVPGHGSWVMLGEIYLDFHVPPDIPLNRDCGRCSICIDRCPTGAIVEPYRIHAPRCISFLTIEERGVIPREIRPFMGNWVFGCDVCQDVCPYTGAAHENPDPDFMPRTIDNAFPSLETLATMDERRYLELFAGTAVTRAKRRGLARNAAVALGNSQHEQAIPILRRMIESHDEPLARAHAAWALAHLAGWQVRDDLRRAARREEDPLVLTEIEESLGDIS